MSHTPATDSLGECLRETELIKDLDKIKGIGDISLMGDAVLKAQKAKMTDRKKLTALAGPSLDASDRNQVLRKRAVIKSVYIPAKMSRENIGMADKPTEYDKFGHNQPMEEIDGTPEQTGQVLQDSSDFLLHVVLLALVTTIGIHMVPLSRYYYHDTLTHFLMDSTFITKAGSYKKFWDIILLDQVWAYFSGILIPLIYSGVNDKIAASFAAMFKNPKDLLLMNNNILVTLPRIRQVRVRNDSCEVPEGFVYLLDSCYYLFTPELEDKEPFGLGDGTLWTYSDPSLTEATTVSGEVMKYTGGGYYMDFLPTLEKTQELYDEMWNNTWIDHGTRAVIIDLASYTQRDNLFCIVTLLLELPPSGGVITSADVRTQKLLRYESVEDLMILGLELALATLLILFTVDHSIKCWQQPLNYVSNSWNLVDWLLFGLGYATMAVGVWRYVTVQKQLSGLLQAIRSKKHFSFYSVRNVQTSYENIFACFALVAWLRTCRYGSLFGPGAMIFRAFRKVRTELVALTLMLLIMVFGFALLAHVLFGSDLREFSTVRNSFFSLIFVLVGGLDFYGRCAESRPVLARFFFIGYIFVVILLFANWFVATIVYGLKEASREDDKFGEEIFIHDILKNAFKKCLLFCRCRKMYVEIDEKDMKKPSDSEIIENLLDRNGFSQLERNLFLRRHGISMDDSSNGKSVNVEDVIADLNGINRHYVEVDEHQKIHEGIDSLKERLELLDHKLADVIVKSDVLIDKNKLQEMQDKAKAKAKVKAK